MLQREVAEQLGVDETTVYNWESGRHAPSARFAARIRGFLDTQYDTSSVVVSGSFEGTPISGQDASDLTLAAEL
jgi:transcriptional regulator with XRE-family HTH domain